MTRPAAPEDVLAQAPASRARRPQSRSGRAGRLIPIAAAVLAVAAVAWLAMQGADRVERPVALAQAERLRRSGSFDDARAALAGLDAWAERDPRHRALLDEERAALAALERAVAQRRDRVLAEAAERTYAELNAALQQEERGGGDPAVQLAARIVRGQLTELLRQAEAQQRAAYQPPPASAAEASAEDAEAAADALDMRVADLEAALADVDRLAGEGLFGPALASLADAIAAAPVERLGALERRRIELRKAAADAAQALAADARRAAAAGEHDEAIAALERARSRFPGDAQFATLPALLAQLKEQREQRDAEAAVAATAPAAVGGPAGGAATAEATRRTTLAEIGALLDRIRAREQAGDFAGGEQLLRQAADLVAGRDPDYAARLRLRADELAQLAGLHAAAREAFGADRRVEVSLQDGRLAELHGVELAGVDGAALLATTRDGEQRLRWYDLTAASVTRLVAALELDGPPLLGAATLLYRDGAAEQAEALLARALRRDASLEDAVDRAIARGRGEPLAPGGYELTKAGFRSQRQLAAAARADELVTQLGKALRGRDPDAREACVRQALAEGPLVTGPVVQALRRLLQREVEELEGSRLRKQLEKLDAQRDVLDAARAHAKDLIFDTDTYFYPYKPPQVSAERYAEYLQVQAEVNRRTAALRAVWQDDRVRVKVPAATDRALERVDWLTGVLAEFQASAQQELAAIEWARALLPGEALTVQSYCRTVAEREQLVDWRHIERYNRIVEKQLSAGEREQLRITNDYRLMFGHRPLALHPAIARAARGHADEMAQLGYFSHFSPTDGRRTPYDRMRLEGYQHGVSENIAGTGSPEAAHHAWCRSSGHHRNLLNPNHTEFGIGGVGRNWVQNFGSGRTHRGAEAWQQAAAR